MSGLSILKTNASGVRLLLALLLFVPGAVVAHPGDLDEWGGHFDEKTHLYHYHKPRLNIGKEKQQHLLWESFPDRGVVRQTAGAVTFRVLD